MIRIFLSVWSLLILLTACTTRKQPVHQFIPYNLSEPDNKVWLNKELVEISGLEYIGNGELAAIQDEKGVVYILDQFNGEILREIEFHKKGDFEGIAMVKDDFYVNRSDGHLYLINKGIQSKKETKAFKTSLSSKNDIEGLCYNEAKNELFLLCKEEAGITGKIKEKKAIYSFPLKTKKLSAKPRFLIDLKEVNQMLYTLYGEKKEVYFKPSGIDIHPLTNNLYIVTSIGRLLIVLDEDGRLIDVAKLPSHLFKQAEGITFDKEGNLFISNEGVKGKSNILKFNLKR